MTVVENEKHGRGEGAGAKLLLIALALAWGLTWPANKEVLFEVSPWTFRVVGLAVGGVVTFALVTLRGRSLAIPRGKPRLHVVVAGMFNVGIFAISSTFALQATGASRVVILVYTMPIWTSLVARVVLGEKLTPLRLTAVGLCAAGLAVLLAPHLPLPGGLWYALITAWAWTAGTVYMKWAQIPADSMAITAWQIAVGWVAVAIGTAILGEPWFVWPLQPVTVFAWVYASVVGVGVGYFLWFLVVEWLPASNAGLAGLLTPVIGVVSSAVLLGEPPTLNDSIGFVLIFAAAACVLLQPSRRLVAAGAE